MPKQRTYIKLVGDFETTVFSGQQRTDVWASAVVQIGTEDVHIFHSIGETFEYLKSLDENIIIYYHNLKFDGMFWLDYFINVLHLEQAYRIIANPDIPSERQAVQWLELKEMKPNTFEYSISDKGQWYRILVNYRAKNKHTKRIEFRDSLKLMPFSVMAIGKAFETKHQKLDMEYEGLRYPGCEITPEEQKYIANDVLVVKEALEYMFSEGHEKLTIGSCCLSEYKTLVGKDMYNTWFPNVYDMEIDESMYGQPTAGDYILKSYRGGWCYLVHGKENQKKYHGTTGDVNSLYPSMMSSESGNRYPVGSPHFWSGNFIPDEAKTNNKYYFVRIRTAFKIKKNMLPFIQIKGSKLYPSTEMLETSDTYDILEKKWCHYIRYNDGSTEVIRPTMTMTCTDYVLFREHYDVSDFEILDGCWFYTEIGIFDDYIEKYKKIKIESKGAKRTLAKLFLNNLYGKMASTTNSSFKVAFPDITKNNTINFYEVKENDKMPGYIPVGSAITSYARNFTIRAAQKNYYGVHERGFIYADTDSIHCDLKPEEFKGITVHPKNFCCWKLETCWDVGLFVRQKTYAEHVTHEDEVPVEKSYWNIKCAGLPDRCKNLFVKSIEGTPESPEDKYDEEELKFLHTPHTIDDFKIGLKVPGKLMPKRIPGGILLVKSMYEMHKKVVF